MEGMLKKFFDKKLGDFIKADEMKFEPGKGYIGIKKAEFKTETFDHLHLPFALKGGFIDEMSVSLPVSMFTTSPAKVVIKNVFFVFGTHATDWTWDDVHKCKTKLVDLIMKIYELKPVKKAKSKKEQAQANGWLADTKKKFMEDLAKKFLGMLEVEISNIHFRFEDSLTQVHPFAAGFKMGSIIVNSKANASQLRTTGDWKHSPERHADPFFCQSVMVRRISSYWDIGEGTNLFGSSVVPGQQVFQKFMKLNTREIWRLAAVENILKLFPPDHPRRKYLEGPRFRERLDYHSYILFPASLNAHITVNRPSDAMRLQKAPMKDADVIFDPVEVALDSEQIRSLNELLAYQKKFKRQDELFRTRPKEAISKYLQAMDSTRAKSNSSSSPSPAEQERRKKLVVRSWWHHAFQGVRIMCVIPKTHMDQEELKQKAKLREEYINLCLQDMQAADREKEEGEAGAAPQVSRGTVQSRLKDMQMLLALGDILNWRMLARERRAEKAQQALEEAEAEEETIQSGVADSEQEKVMAAMPDTMQVRMHFSAFQAFFLVVADSKWSATLAGQAKLKLENSRPTRQLAVKAQALDIRMDVVQRGRKKHRIARWAEVGIGSISATNCNAKTSTPATRSARQILSIMPFEHRQGVPLCVYVGVTTFEVFEKNVEPGDIPLTAVLEPSEGVLAHLQDLSKERPELLKKLGCLEEYAGEPGRLMLCAFVRVGQVRALDYTPFRRRLMYFLKRGRGDTATDLVRRPSPLALDRELLVKLQRKVEKITGKSNMLGIIEGVTDGVRGRLVDHYNSQHVLCKEVSLAPMRCKALRNGCPQTFHCQFHQMLPKEDQRPGIQSMGESFGLLPWKAAMLLLPKADFSMGMELEADKQEAQKKICVSPVKKPSKEVVEIPDPATIALAGTMFLKWGRNGKAKKRFISFNESNNIIEWRDSDRVGAIVKGALPLSKIQDVCEGVKTPVLLQVRSAQLRPDRVWSIIATDRTLDLQAESPVHRERWVSGLKARYKKYLQRQIAEPEALLPLPGSLEKKVKSYPEKYRSDLCDLRATCKRLQSVPALTKNADASSNLTKRVVIQES